MALRMIESWDTYGTANLTEGRWTSLVAGVAASVALSAGTGRRGTGSLRLSVGSTTRSQASLRKTFDNQATWIIGVAFACSGVANGACDILALVDGGTAQIDLMRQANGLLSVTRGGTLLGTSGAPVTSGTYTFIELKVTIHPTTGSVVLRMNGVTQLALAGINTRQTANSYAQEVILGNKRLTNVSGLAFYTDDYDDLYICDGTGAAPFQDFLGDCRVDATIPNSDSLTQWTPSTPGTHYALVDENPPATADYLEAASAGLSDRFGIVPLPLLTNPQIYAVGVNLYGRNPEAGGRQIAAQMESSATVATSAPMAITDAWLLHQGLFLTDPSTGLPWTQAQLNAAKVGVTVSA